MRKRLMPIVHITQYFWPPIGGQEKIILNLCNIAAKQNRWSIVIQPLKKSNLMPKYFGLKLPKKTIILAIPTYVSILILFNKIYKLFFKKKLFSNEYIDDLSWISFNFSLKFVNLIFSVTNFKSINFIHYHFHRASFKANKSIIFSHGVEWERPARRSIDKKRISLIENLIFDDGIKIIIANDRDYLIEVNNINQDLNNNKTKFIPNPVDVEHYYDVSTLEVKFNYKRIIIIRNIRQDRGIREGIKAFNLIKKEQIFKDWKMDIYGAYNSNDEYYMNCLRESEISGDIKFHGPIKSEDVVNELRKSTIALVPSQDKEGTSLSALEAMASSVLCISTPIGGLLDMPTYKSTSVGSQDIALAIKAAYTDYENILIRQIKITHENFDLKNWNERIMDCIAEVENE